MQVQCAICDKIESINPNSFLAKKLINKKIRSYLCDPCYERITVKTKARLDTGKFVFRKGTQL